VIKEQYIDTGKVYYVYKDFPLVSLHPQAGLAAQAAECAGDQGRYWKLHHKLFDNPQAWDTSSDEAIRSFRRYAEQLGIDGIEMEQCLVQGRYADAVQRNFDEGRRLGITGTPAFIINGKLLAGAHPTEVFTKVLDRELQPP